jgi:TatA/E family protein of Tat protein translocase
MFSPSPMHLLLLGLIVLLVMGPKRLPEVARSLGRGFRELKGAISDDEAAPATALAVPSAAEYVTEVELVEARQATPAPTPEIAEAELVAAADARAR